MISFHRNMQIIKERIKMFELTDHPVSNILMVQLNIDNVALNMIDSVRDIVIEDFTNMLRTPVHIMHHYVMLNFSPTMEGSNIFTNQDLHQDSVKNLYVQQKVNLFNEKYRKISTSGQKIGNVIGANVSIDFILMKPVDNIQIVNH